jgi:hypothetical protein
MPGSSADAAATARGARGFEGARGGTVAVAGSFAGWATTVLRRAGALGDDGAFAAVAGFSGTAGDCVRGEAGRRGK